MMRFKYIHPANCGFRPHGIYTIEEISSVLGERTSELLNDLFVEIKKESDRPIQAHTPNKSDAKHKADFKNVNKRR